MAADIGDLVKIFQQVTEYLMSVEKSAKKATTGLSPFTKELKNLSSVMKKSTKDTEDFSDSITMLNKDIAGTDYSSFIKGAAKVKNVTKEVEGAQKAYNELHGSVEDMQRSMKYLNIADTQQIRSLREMVKGIDSTCKALDDQRIKLKGIEKVMLGVDGSFNKFKNYSGGIQKTGVDSFFEKTKDILTELGGVVSESDFKSLEDSIKNLDNVEFKDLPKEIEKIKALVSKTDIKLPSKNVDEFSKKLFDSISGSYTNVQKNFDVGTKKIIDDLISIKDSIKFGSLDKESKDTIDNFIENLKKGESSAVEFGKVMEIIESKFGQQSKDIKDKLNESTKEIEKFNKAIEEPRRLKIHIDMEESRTKDTISHLTEKKQAVGLSEPEEEHLKTSEDLLGLLEQKKQILSDTVNVDKKDLKVYKSIEKEIKKITKQLRLNNELSERYEKIVEDVEKEGFGIKKVQALSDGLFTASAHLNKFKDYLDSIGPDLGKKLGIGKLGGFLNTLGQGVMKNKAVVGTLVTTVSLLEKVIQFDASIKKMYKNVADSGVAIGVSAKDMGDSLDKSFSSSLNVAELLRGGMLGVNNSLILGQEDILGMAGAFISTGISAGELEKQAKTVNDRLGQTKNALLVGAETAHVFGRKLGKTDTEMASMIGDLTFQYSSSLDSVRQGFSDVAAAASTSSMGANKFMSIVQTSTAGMAMYQDQVEDTAKALAKMEGTKLTGKEKETTIKGAAGLAQDPRKAAEALAIIGGDKQKEIEGVLLKKREELVKKLDDAKSDKDKKIAKQELDNADKLIGFFKNKNWAEAGSMAFMMPMEAKMKLWGSYVKKLIGEGALDPLKAIEMLTNRGFSLEAAQEIVKTQGEMANAAEGTAEGEGKEAPKAEYKDLQIDIAAEDEKTKSRIVTSIDSIFKLLQSRLGSWAGPLEGILSGISSIATWIIGGKILKGLGALIMGGKSATAPIVEGLGKAVGTGTGPIVEGLGKTLGPASKTIKVLGKLGKGMPYIGGALSFGAAILSGEGVKRSAIEAAAGVVGSVVGGAAGTMIAPGAGTFLGAAGGGAAAEYGATKLLDFFGVDKGNLTEPVTKDFTSLRGAEKGEVTTNKNINDSTFQAPTTIVQNFYGVTDKNFVAYVNTAMNEIQRKRSQ